MSSLSTPGNFYRQNEAVLLTIQMALLTTCLTAVGWIVSPYVHKNLDGIPLGVTTGVETVAVLALYTAVVLVWRQNWRPEKVEVS